MSVIEAQKVLMAHVALADGEVNDAEVATAIAIANEVGGMGRFSPRDVQRQIKYLIHEDLDRAIEEILVQSEDRRLRFVRMMWVMALSDGPLDPREETVILQFADRLNISRQDAETERNKAILRAGET